MKLATICGRCEHHFLEFGMHELILCKKCLIQINFTGDKPCTYNLAKARERFNKLNNIPTE